VFWLPHLASALNLDLDAQEAARMDRRTFLLAASGAATSSLLTSDLLAAGFTAAEHDRTRDDWDQIIDHHGRAYMREGALGIRDRLVVDLVAIQRHLPEPWGWSTAAVLATLYAKTLPSSDHGTAVQWYRRAAGFADRSRDDHARVWVRGRAAVALAYDGSGIAAADQLAQEALAISTAPSTGRLTALLGAAHVAALRGDNDAGRRLWEDASRVLDRVGVNDAVTDYAVPYWRHAIWVSGAAARAGDVRAASAAQEDARAAIPAGYDRFRTHLDMHHGLMLARAGKMRDGVEHVTAALNALPATQRSLTLRRLAAEVRAV
jgi:hypothetical protein